MRILALDWGSTRIGAAVSDPDGKIAFPLDKILPAKDAEKEIKKIVLDLKVEKIIIGLPKNLLGEEGRSAKKVLAFLEKLKRKIDTEIELVDERFSSVEAAKKLSEQGLKERHMRKIADNIAAQIMLERYLDTKNN